jgi:DNA primase
MSAYIDFGELKRRVSIEQVVQMLGLQMKRSGPQLRSGCPMCRSGGERALAVTVERSSFYCFAKKEGGDAIALASHVLGIPPREAGEKIASHFGLDGSSQAPQPRPGKETATPPARGMAVSEAFERVFESLDPLAPEVEVFVTPSTADIAGIGFSNKGWLRGRVGVPVYSRDGVCLGFFGIAPGADVIFHKSIEEQADNVVALRKKPA